MHEPYVDDQEIDQMNLFQIAQRMFMNVPYLDLEGGLIVSQGMHTQTHPYVVGYIEVLSKWQWHKQTKQLYPNLSRHPYTWDDQSGNELGEIGVVKGSKIYYCIIPHGIRIQQVVGYECEQLAKLV